MKYFSLIIFLTMYLGVDAQDVRITEDQENYKESTYPAFSIYLEPNTKDVKKNLKDYFKDQDDVQLKGIGFLTNKDVLYAEEKSIDAISTKKMDLYAKVVEEGARTKLSFFGAFGYDIPLSPSGDYQAYQNMRGAMVGFLNDYLPGYYTEQVEEVKEEVEDLREEKADLKDDISDNKEDIKDKLSEIESLRKENEALANQLKETNSKLISSEVALKSTQTELMQVNTQLKSLSKDNK